MKPWGTLTLKEVETLRELLTRFESVSTSKIATG